MRVACVLVTHLRAKVELRKQPRLADRPAVIVDRSKGRPLVVDTFPATAGVSAGMTLEQALSQHPGTVVLEADEPSYQREFRRMLASLQSISDRVEGAELGTAYVRLDGLENMYGGEARLASALLHSVSEYLHPRVGLGEGKFPSFVAARVSRTQGATRVPSDAVSFLAPHSIGLLPLASHVKDKLHRFGLHTMGDVASMRVDLLTDQFGPGGMRAWSLSRGIDDTPLIPLKYEESIVESTSLPFSSTSMELLQTAVDALLKRAYSRPQMRGRYAGTAVLSCILDRAPSWEKPIHFKQAVGDWERASRIIRGRMESDHPQAPVEEMALSLSHLSGVSGVQMGLFRDAQKDRHLRLLEAERQCQARMNGSHALYKVVDVAPWHPAPEMRAVQVPIDPSARDAMKPLSLPTAVAVQEGPELEPVAVRLGRRWQQVSHIDDLWSFDLWWMPTPMSRTYYRISREDGRQVTLFRDQRGSCWYQQGS